MSIVQEAKRELEEDRKKFVIDEIKRLTIKRERLLDDIKYIDKSIKKLDDGDYSEFQGQHRYRDEKVPF